MVLLPGVCCEVSADFLLRLTKPCLPNSRYSCNILLLNGS